LIDTTLQRIKALAGEPGDTVILAAGGVGKGAQPVGCAHALGGRQACFRMPCAKRKLYQRCLPAHAEDGNTAAPGVPRAACHGSAYRIGAVVCFQQRARTGAVCGFGKRVTQRAGERGAHVRIGFGLPGSGEHREIIATLCGGGTDLRRRIGGEQMSEFFRVRCELGGAEHPLRGIGMFVQGRAQKHSGSFSVGSERL